jgi:hypothetical protein
VARRQVVLSNARGQGLGSNEVVAYDSAQQGAKALAEFRASVTRCPRNTFQHSKIAGVPDMRYDVSQIVRDSKLPVKDNAIATITLTVKGSNQRMYLVYIFQRKGTVLDGIYMHSTTKPTAAALKLVQQLAVLTGKRLAALH